MTRISRWLGLSLLALAVSAFVAAGPAGGASGTTFSGRAVGISGTVADVLGNKVKAPCAPTTPYNQADCQGVADTGSIEANFPTGGALDASLFCYPENAYNQPCAITLPDLTSGIARARVLHASVVAQGNQSRAQATAADVGVNLGNIANVGDVTVSATALDANATAKCTGGVPSVSGSVELLRADVNGGQLINVTVGPETFPVIVPENPPVNYDVVAQLPDPAKSILQQAGFKIILNKQDANQPNNSLTLTALYVETPAGTALSIGTVHADINCGSAPGGGCDTDKMTSGGWYNAPTAVAGGSVGDRVHFALAAKNGISSWGHLLYMHKAIGLQVRGTPFMSTMFSNGAPKNGGDALVQGPASANRQFNNQSVGWFEVVAQDWNEPGRGADKFAIVLLTAQTNGTELYRMNLPAAASIAADASLTTALDGGNIQYHHCK